MASLSRVLIGRPLPNDAMRDERLSQPKAMGAFGIDALSSVAYGPDEILYVLLLAGSAGAAWGVPVAIALAGLLAVVVFSYRQTIHAYPHGGGSFTVARENLGTTAGLFAASSLMVDYVLTVAVSSTAGIQALGTFIPSLNDHRVIACIAAILALILVNLRGVKEAGALFVLPAYLFVGSLGALLIIALVRISTGAHLHSHIAAPPVSHSLTLLLVLRAFASGCSGLTGVEAVANGVPVFRSPESKNAARALTLLAFFLGILLIGVSLVGHHINAVPTDDSNIISQIGQAIGSHWHWLFYVVQVATAITLLLAANTPFNGFPMLAAVMAKEEFFPHQFQNRGQRLAYSNGIVVVGLAAIALLLAFGGSTHALIPLYSIGVFLCFTLSQAGMVQHWRRERIARWQLRLAVNATGAFLTGLVTVIVIIEKFTEGAWLIVFIVPAIAWMFAGVRRHYDEARQELRAVSGPRRRHQGHIIVPVNKLDKSTVQALEYAMSMSVDVLAVHISTDEDRTTLLIGEWNQWEVPVTLEIVPSPYRDVIGPLIKMIDNFRDNDDRHLVTLIVPEVVPHRWWHEPLHNQTGLTLEFALRYHPGVVVTTIPVRLER
jgi:amino acid transporter